MIKHIGLVLVIFIMSGCSKQEPVPVFLSEGSGVWVHVDGTKDRFYKEENFTEDNSCDSNEVLVNNKCKLAIRVGDLIKSGFRVVAMTTDTEQEYTLRIFYLEK